MQQQTIPFRNPSITDAITESEKELPPQRHTLEMGFQYEPVNTMVPYRLYNVEAVCRLADQLSKHESGEK